MRDSGFYYLFQHFKRFYLPYIFPLWDPTDRLFVKSDGNCLLPYNSKKNFCEFDVTFCIIPTQLSWNFLIPLAYWSICFEICLTIIRQFVVIQQPPRGEQSLVCETVPKKSSN